MSEIKARSISQLQLSGIGGQSRQQTLLLTDRSYKNNTLFEGGEFKGSRTQRNYNGQNSTLKNRPMFAGNVTEAHKQLTNKSQSKNVHDFGKGEDRFKIYDRQARSINQSIGYNLPSTLKQKPISFGVGGRSVPELKNIFHGGPDPGAYNLPSDFDKSTHAN